MDHIEGAIITPSVTQRISATGNYKSRAKTSRWPIVYGENTFAINLFTKCEIGDNNIVTSPKSYIDGLQIVGFAAVGNTRKEIEDSLGGDTLSRHYDPNEELHHRKGGKLRAMIMKRLGSHSGSQDEVDSPPSPAMFEVVNKICVKKGIHVDKGFISQVKSVFGAKVEQYDFAGNVAKCREQINSSVSKHTKGRITSVVNESNLTTATSLLLVNCVYFKSNWEIPFDVQQTKQRQFTLTSGEKVATNFMFKKDKFHYQQSTVLECTAVELMYAGREHSFVVILPNNTDGLLQLEKRLNADNLTNMFENMKEVEDLFVFLPKFNASSNLELSDSFKSLGIRDLFNPGQASLAGIESTNSLYVSGIAHRVFLEVNEHGCEAAAVTCEVLRSAGRSASPTIFDANHPFLYLIKHNPTNAIVFLGRFCSP